MWSPSPEFVAELLRVTAMTEDERNAYFAQFRPKCSRCVFFHATGGGSAPYIMFCRRYPEHRGVLAEHWCGEFKESPTAEPKRIL